MPHLSKTLCASIALVCLCSMSMVSDAQAQQVRRKFKDKIHVIQPKPVLQKGRLDISPRVGYTVNDSLASTPKAGVGVAYHFSERFYVGAMFDWFQFGSSLSGATDAYDQTFSQTQAAPDTPVPNFMGGLEVGWVPAFGKFALFNSGILFYDISLSLGGGWMDAQSIQITTGAGSPAVTFAVTSHIFVSDWLSLNLGVRDVSYQATLNGAADKVLAHTVTVDLGFGLYFPESVREETAAASK